MNLHVINPNVSVDCVIFGFCGNNLEVLLIERSPGDVQDLFLLPGDLIYEDETLDEAAGRVLKELTHLEDIYLEQVYTFGNPNRIAKEEDRRWLKSMRAHPEARVISVVYSSLVNKELYSPTPSGFARNAVWVPVQEVPVLAFDHNEMLIKAQAYLKQKIYHEPLGFELLPQKFTIAQLQKLHEAILEEKLDKRNFRRKILKNNFITPLNEKQIGVAHKPAQLYKFNREWEKSASEEFAGKEA